MTISTQAPLAIGFHRNAVSRVRQARVVRTVFKATKWIFDPYRPERHYMRGPGPKWREKHMRQSSI